MAWSRALGGVSSPSRERSAVCHSGLGRDDSGVVICEDGGADPRWQRLARMEAADAVRTAAGMEDVALDSSETRPGLIGDGHGPYLQFLSTIARVSSWVKGSRSPVPLAKFHGEGT